MRGRLVKRRPILFETATALVTGAGSGIGRATALALAAKGATVLCTDIDEAAAEKTAAECGERSSSGGQGGHAAYRLDVADRAEVDAVAATVEPRTRCLDRSWSTTPGSA